MNRKFRGKSQHRGNRKPFHHTRKDFSSNKKHFHKINVNKASFNNGRDGSKGQYLSRLKETDVGITEYISNHEGFNGIIKQRYSDFQVNEIEGNGTIVTLTSIELPAAKVPPGNEKLDHEEHLKSVVSVEVTEMNKDDRRKLHSAIKAVGSGQLVSNTKEKEEKKFMVVCKHSSKVKSERSRWPTEYGGDYVYFVLHKENLDTMETVNLIASRLRIKPNMITYAGTKDRRAVTSQMMSILRTEPKRLLDVSSQLYGVSVGNFSFKSKGLKLGDLKGNRFRIALRNVTGSDDQIEKAMASLSEQGFLNYYGLQRFGSSVSVPTHAIGKALLLGDWKLAIELILKPREGEPNHSLARARKIWWETRDATKALKDLPNREKLIEGKLLMGLSQCAANDFVNALENIPRNTRLLYLHSYQSLIWNKVVSRRVKELGIKPIAGDLVFVNENQLEIDPEQEEAEESEKTDPADHTSKKDIVRIITEDDLANVLIQDVVMPLPGHEVVYPKNVMKDWYEGILKEDGLSSASLKQTVRKYSVGGAYRKMIIRPDNVKWKTMHYSEPFKTLELSDKEKMENKEAPKDEPDGTYKALLLDFCLPSSTYATMALREILKSDTSSQHQASLNNYHIQKGKVCDDSVEPSEETVYKPSSSSSTKPTEETRSEQNDPTKEISGEIVSVNDEKIEKSEEVMPAESCSIRKEKDWENEVEIGGESRNDENIIRKREIDNNDGDVLEKKMKLDVEEKKSTE
ncbi:Pseudouridylate synthase 7 homolog-like Protein [Gryllus bimaculatus]|nr:Pseudouridylate synthase 7 homolog-like Protein [Gryllus bimaculatus]